MKKIILVWLAIALAGYTVDAQVKISTIAKDGWANNSVNTIIFRKNALVTHQNVQYAAYYDAEQYVVLAKRNLMDSAWTVMRTRFRGDATDAHRSISIMVDGRGYLHVSWGHHDSPLNYALSVKPGSLRLSEKRPMTGANEQKVSYPEFYRLRSGDLLFAYREGSSGNGSLILNRYNVAARKWSRIQDKLIDGEGKRNAYWQITTGEKNKVYISWVWRESPNVASNHDLCFARSDDGGVTWSKSTGEKYRLPITAANAEYACRIPENSELINQTSMAVAHNGTVLIATYFRDSANAVPQFQIVFNPGNGWQTRSLGFRKTNFTLSGVGTKSIPVSRPQVVTWTDGGHISAAIVFRDAERGSKVSLASATDIEKGGKWELADLTDFSVGAWEPAFDTELWVKQRKLHLFVQEVTQVDLEGLAVSEPRPVFVLELPLISSSK